MMRGWGWSVLVLSLGCEAQTLPLTAPPIDPAEDLQAIEAQLSGLRWELPCVEHVYPEVCTVDGDAEVITKMAGQAGARYSVQLRVRGIVEPTSYPGGVSISPSVSRGGVHDAEDPWNVYALEVEQPFARFHLNAGESGLYHCVSIDAQLEVEIEAGAEIRLFARSIDGRQITNRDAEGSPILVPDIAPYPLAYDGQFLEMTVENIRVR